MLVKKELNHLSFTNAYVPGDLALYLCQWKRWRPERKHMYDDCPYSTSQKCRSSRRYIGSQVSFGIASACDGMQEMIDRCNHSMVTYYDEVLEALNHLPNLKIH
ncbi:hypothetical protein LRAMOSA10483 [Lichtheimia ramosa]|uniref:Uncharacterized protein n=1 Tax=Lichtheimia ramosa TaxID=688394 RepID=A0A077WPU6_9FUNG|nr:hypothetical protein LRAMOSA10483 [Lichtheimia ramosa]